MPKIEGLKLFESSCSKIAPMKTSAILSKLSELFLQVFFFEIFCCDKKAKAGVSDEFMSDQDTELKYRKHDAALSFLCLKLMKKNISPFLKILGPENSALKLET